MNTIHWAGLENMHYAPLALVCVLLVCYRFFYWNKSVSLLNAAMMQRASTTRQIAKMVLMMLAILFLFAALIRPQWHKKDTVLHQEGRDVFIALDISRSMLAQDCKPNRISCAKRKIKQLLSKMSCERVGLILFSGSTFVQCPLTTDYNAFYMFLDSVDVETISSGTTALDQALITALKSFKAGASRKNKLLVLFTDGEDFSSHLSSVKEEAAKEGLTIFALGIGTTQGAPIPVFDEKGNAQGHQLDAKGSVVISRLNEGILNSVATDCGGSYIAMTQEDTDLKKLVSCLQRFEKERLEDKTVTQYEEQYVYCVAMSFVCLLLDWVL